MSENTKNIEMTKESRESLMEEALEESYQDALKQVEVLDAEDDDDDDFVDDLSDVVKRIKRPVKNIKFEDVDNPDIFHKFQLSPLTPSERLAIDKTLMPKNVIQDAMRNAMKASQQDKDLDEDALEDQVIDELATEENVQLMLNKQNDRKYLVVMYGIRKPTKGVTLENVKAMPSDWVDTMHYILEEVLTVNDTVWAFPQIS